MTSFKEDVQKMANLKFIAGRLMALDKLAGCARQTMAFYGIGCDHPEEVPDSDVALSNDEYRDALAKIEDKVLDESQEIFDRLKEAENVNLLVHINTLNIVWGYNTVLESVLSDLEYFMSGWFIETGSERPDLIRGRVIGILDSIKCQIKQYQDLINMLKKDTEKRIKEVI